MSQTTFSTRKCSDCVCLQFFLLVLLALTKDCVGAKELKSPAIDFNKHIIIQPIVYHGRTRREISTTRDTNGAHHSEVTVTIPVDGEELLLDLRLNEDLVTGGHTLQYQERGKTVIHKPKKEELDLCHYSGSVRGKRNSWVAVSTCRGVRGVIFDGQRMRYIEPAEGSEIQIQHYLYDHNDLNTDYHCGFHGGVTNNSQYHPEFMKKYHEHREIKKSRYKREIDDQQVQGPYDANKLSRYVELVLVADYKEFQANGANIRTVHSQLIHVANIINSVYSPLNIYIALVGVDVWSERDEIRLEENGDTTLTNFLKYREKKLNFRIPNDNAQLLTRKNFNGGVVGKGLKGLMCTASFSGGIATNHSEVISLVAMTIAHEMGHNFGMEHDTDENCVCPDEKCIMSPSSTNVVPVHWSSCSLKSLALSFERGMDYCLRNKPKRLLDSPTCGNGFVEPGEQCDCGIVPGGGINPCHACCHADTCMLRSNATCGAGTCCDLTTCRPKSVGTVCRSANRECDLPEFCSGFSEFCPEDLHKMDTTPCGKGDDQAYCVRGSCRSHTDQCRLLWGPSGQNSDRKCYASNTKGTVNGNCGKDPINQMYKSCTAADTLCGMLHCRHLNEQLEFGMESGAILPIMSISNNAELVWCQGAIIDLGVNDVDPGLVPDGAKCGNESMCLNQRCVSVAAVRERIANSDSTVCPSNCSGHGVCNSEGHCHCEPGYAQPLCAVPGPGGSLDSGPATDPSVQRNFMIAMYVIFLGIIPSITLILFLVYYYSRHNALLWWKRPRKSYVSCIPWNCCQNNTKTTFTTRITKLQESTSSLRNLLSFKKRNRETVENDECESKDKTATSPFESDRNEPSLPGKSKTTKSVRKINKVDIQIAALEHRIHNNALEVKLKPVKDSRKPHVPVNPHLAVKPVANTGAKPAVSPKPDRLKAKPSVVIVNKGLASTTNEMLNSKSHLYNVGGRKM